MKVLVLLAETDHFARWEAADADHRARVVADFQAFDAAVRARGAVLGGEALAPTGGARTVRAGADAASRPVTDGPYAETAEQLGGFYLIEVDDLDAAVEVARLLPREYDVEVREVVDEAF
ncbi:YciI family protein [Nocardioides sp. CFH 31398]|uniref:YciI family protein n=1 Tax=Nocardioides sp. CFH 31398 TaxID=2919579 RepID=UPI001F066D9B|nr:YciI family protein [Nocardioides sp. CFH 31398]MCH1867656.1 YciI family protein [Nocardioides sp. CFH 31398]